MFHLVSFYCVHNIPILNSFWASIYLGQEQEFFTVYIFMFISCDYARITIQRILKYFIDGGTTKLRTHRHDNTNSLVNSLETCPHGMYSKSGLVPCTTCEVGFYQPGKEMSACIPCPGARTTASRGAANASLCEGELAYHLVACICILAHR